jgi:hypothetical protein
MVAVEYVRQAADLPQPIRPHLTQDKVILATAGILGMLPAKPFGRRIIAIQAIHDTAEET